MKLKHAKKNSGFTLVELLVVIAIIAGLAAISSPIIIRQIARSRATQAINNSKDIYIGLRDYSISRGQGLPVAGADADEDIITLFEEGYLEDEKPFYVKGVPGAVEGDGDVSDGNALSEDGNNVFAMFNNGGNGINIVTEVANAPLLATPVVAGGNFTDCTYQAASFGSQAVVLRSDGSAAAHNISASTFEIVGPAEITEVKSKSGGDPTFNVKLTTLGLNNS